MNHTTGPAIDGNSVERGVWVVACLLSKHEMHRLALAQTISWQSNCTENEARGRAVAFALESKPGYAVEMATTQWIALTSTKTEAAA